MGKRCRSDRLPDRAGHRAPPPARQDHRSRHTVRAGACQSRAEGTRSTGRHPQSRAHARGGISALTAGNAPEGSRGDPPPPPIRNRPSAAPHMHTRSAARRNRTHAAAWEPEPDARRSVGAGTGHAPPHVPNISTSKVFGYAKLARFLRQIGAYLTPFWRIYGLALRHFGVTSEKLAAATLRQNGAHIVYIYTIPVFFRCPLSTAKGTGIYSPPASFVRFRLL